MWCPTEIGCDFLRKSLGVPVHTLDTATPIEIYYYYDIRRDILELEKLDEKTEKDIVAFVEAKESAKSSWNNQGSSSSLNANDSGSKLV